MWKRFLNPDALLNSNQDILSYNLYAYCSNNPIKDIDPNGEGVLAIAISVIGAVVMAAKITGKLSTKKTKKTETKKKKTPKVTYTKKTYTYADGVKCTRLVVNQNHSLPDYTEPLNKAIAEHLEEAKKVKFDITQENLWYFYKKNTDISWDFKQLDGWNASVKGYPFLGQHGPFIWNGYIITAEQFGNIHYGIVGSEMFPPTILYMGGGYANKSTPMLEMIKGPYYGDGADDHCSVVFGIEMYEKFKK